MAQDAVIRNFEVIGEASHNIEVHFPEFAQAHPELPLAFAYEMRNAVAHGYFKVDLEIVWKTLRNDLSGLYAQVSDTLQGLPAKKAVPEWHDERLPARSTGGSALTSSRSKHQMPDFGLCGPHFDLNVVTKSRQTIHQLAL